MANDGAIVKVEGYPAVYMADYNMNVFSAETVLKIFDDKVGKSNKLLNNKIREMEAKLRQLENSL